MFVSSRLRFCRCSQKLKGALYSFNLGVTCGVRNREEERRGFVYFLTKKRKIKTTACRGGVLSPLTNARKGWPAYRLGFSLLFLKFWNTHSWDAIWDFTMLSVCACSPRVWGQQAPYPHLSRSFLFFCSNNIFLSYGYHVNSCSCEDVMKIKTILAPHT